MALEVQLDLEDDEGVIAVDIHAPVSTDVSHDADVPLADEGQVQLVASTGQGQVVVCTAPSHAVGGFVTKQRVGHAQAGLRSKGLQEQSAAILSAEPVTSQHARPRLGVTAYMSVEVTQ